MKRHLSTCAALLLLLSLNACTQNTGARERSDFVLGTACTVRLLDGGNAKALDAVFARLREIENSMSANNLTSTVAEINAKAGIAPVKVGADLAYVAEKALYYAGISGGAFDPTIGIVVKLWNIGLDGERVPEPQEIKDALPLVGYKMLKLDKAAGTIYLEKKGMRLDLGAIAKGYAADEASRILLERGTKAAVIDLGGNIKVIGRKPDKSAWKIGVQNPFDLRGNHIGLAKFENTATVVTSGIYERYFIGEDGTSYHHILNSKDGYPVRNGLVSVSIITESSIDADGLSTTLFALGLEKGRALAESLPGVYAIFIDADKKVYESAGSEVLFTLNDANFTLVRK